jgi:hypothetical protein
VLELVASYLWRVLCTGDLAEYLNHLNLLQLRRVVQFEELRCRREKHGAPCYSTSVRCVPQSDCCADIFGSSSFCEPNAHFIWRLPVCEFERFRRIVRDQTIARKWAVFEPVPLSRLVVVRKSLDDVKDSHQTPPRCDVSVVFCFASQIHNSVSNLKAWRKFIDTACRCDGRKGRFEIRFASARPIDERRQSVLADRSTTVGGQNQGSVCYEETVHVHWFYRSLMVKAEGLRLRIALPYSVIL